MENPNKKINFIENELKKLETFDSIFFRGKSHFEDDGTQNYWVFQTTHRYFKTVSNTNDYVLSCKSKGLSDEINKPLSTSNNILNLLEDYVCAKIRVAFKESCLKQDKISFDYEKIVNIYIVYEINKNFSINSYLSYTRKLFVWCS